MNKALQLLLALSVILTSLGNSFVSAHWADGTFSYFTDKGIIMADEIPAESYDVPITRQNFVSIFMKLAQSKGTIDNKVQYFEDVTVDHPIYMDSAKAKISGYVAGYEDNTFRGDNLIQRQELFAIICRAFELQGNDDMSVFLDADTISEYARDAVSKLQSNGIVMGYENGTVMPQSNITYAETFAILERTLKATKTSPGTQTGDKPDGIGTLPVQSQPGGGTTTKSSTSNSSSKSNSDKKTNPIITLIRNSKNEIKATFNGDGSTVVKKCWLRVDLTPGEKDAKALYLANQDKAVLFEGSGRTHEIKATSNGTYIFCLWIGKTTEPDVAKYIDIDNIDIEDDSVIQYTVSTTEKTNDPVTIHVSAGNNANVKEIRWVKINKEYWGQYEESGGYAYLPKDIDPSIFVAMLRGSEEHKQYTELCGGGEFSIDLIRDYYANTIGDDTDTDLSELLVDNEIVTKQNGTFYICAEDLEGNKTFVRVVVSNIELASAEFDVMITDDFSQDTVASIQVTNLIENPNAPVKEMFFVNSLTRSGVGGGAQVRVDENFRLQKALYEYTLANVIIPEIDGKYEVQDFGTYSLYMLDEWGNYSVTTVEVWPEETNDTTPPIIEFILSTDQPTEDPVIITLDIIDDVGVANVKWVKVQGRVHSPSEVKERYEWTLERNTVENNTIEITENGTYIICAIDTSGNFEYCAVTIDNIIE